MPPGISARRHCAANVRLQGQTDTNSGDGCRLGRRCVQERTQSQLAIRTPSTGQAHSIKFWTHWSGSTAPECYRNIAERQKHAPARSPSSARAADGPMMMSGAHRGWLMHGMTASQHFQRRHDGKDQNKQQSLRHVRERQDCEPASETSRLLRAFERGGLAKTFRRNSRIYDEGERANLAYKVVSGSIRAYKLLADGRRQIVAFYLPGDVFGLDVGNEYTQFAESITSSTVLVVKRKLIFELARRDHKLANELREIAWEELRRSQDHVLLLFKSAQGRVAGFLMDMTHSASGASSIQLPMWRHDIADYLGLTVETVSRMLMQFRRASAISLPMSRQIEIRDRAVLRRLSS